MRENSHVHKIIILDFVASNNYIFQISQCIVFSFKYLVYIPLLVIHIREADVLILINVLISHE